MEHRAPISAVLATGCPDSGWEVVIPALRAAGHESAEDAFARWYDDLFQSTGIADTAATEVPLQPDAEMAGQIDKVLADSPEGTCLLADTRSLWLLDFWADRWPEARFLLFYTRPEAAAAHALRNGIDPQQSLTAWLRANRHLLRFLRHHRDRALLFEAESAAANPEGLKEACQRIGLTIEPAERPSEMPVTAPLERWLANSLLVNEADVFALAAELEASAQPLTDAEAAPAPDSAELIEDLLKRNARVVQLARDSESLRDELKKSREESAALQDGRKELEKENELLLLQLQQVQEELEDNVSQRQQVENARVALDATAQELQSQLDEACNARQSLEERNEDVSQENELLLLQLHQVQEELEHYFLKYQELEMHAGKTDVALQDRHPEFCTAQKVTVLGGNQKGGFRNLNCVVEGLEHAGRVWERVNVKLLDTRGEPGLEFRKGADNVEIPLQHWVETGKDDAGAFMVLRPSEPDTLAAMPTADWLLINGLADLLGHHLRTGRYERGEKAEGIAMGRWCASARDLQQQLSALQPSFRFDDVTLREANVADGYEHLWLEFRNAHFTDRLHPSLDFKLAAKGVQGEQFTEHGALAFRNQECGVAPLDAWPPVKVDDFGPVLHLEFTGDLNDEQRAAWESLTEDDRAFVNSLLLRMPEVLERLKRDGHALERPWSQWQQLASVMRSAKADALADGPVADAAPKAASQSAAELQYGAVEAGEVNLLPDYEHLRLDFTDFAWAGKTFPAYSFKLGATNVRDGKFTGHMVLAFRELAEGRAPLECWDQAVKDEHGPVVRLAFGGLLTEEEQADWARLTDGDRKFIDMLLDTLPSILEQLSRSHSSKPIQREWADWKTLVRQQLEEADAA